MTEDEVKKSTEYERLEERFENLRCSIGALIAVVFILMIIQIIESIVSYSFLGFESFLILLLVAIFLNAIFFFKFSSKNQLPSSS